MAQRKPFSPSGLASRRVGTSRRYTLIALRTAVVVRVTGYEEGVCGDDAKSAQFGVDLNCLCGLHLKRFERVSVTWPFILVCSLYGSCIFPLLPCAYVTCDCRLLCVKIINQS